MAKQETVTRTLTIGAKAGGTFWPEGEQEIPKAIEADLEDAGVLVPLPVPETDEERKPPDPASTTGPAKPVELPPIDGLTPEQSTLLRNAVKGIPQDQRKADGVPKADAVNDALKTARAGFTVKAEQIAAAMETQPAG